MSIKSQNVLVLANDSDVDKFVSSSSEKTKWLFSFCSSADDALNLLEKTSFFALIFATTRLPDIFSFVKTLKSKFPKLPFVALLEKDEKNLTTDLLGWGGYSCLEKDVPLSEIVFQLDRLSSEYDVYNPFSVHSEERTIVIPNDFSIVVHVVKSLVYNTLPSDEKNKFQIIMGLNEIVNNAIEHGNLGITFEEKSEALKEGRFFLLAKERSKQEPYKNRVVTISTEVAPSENRVVYNVKDGGDGFNWRNLPDPRDKTNILNRNGRGLMIAQYAFEEVAFNEAGNEVTLTYVRHPEKT